MTHNNFKKHKASTITSGEKFNPVSITVEQLQLELEALNNSFNFYSNKKAYATGMLDLALITTNFTQLKQQIESKSLECKPLDTIIITCICLSLILQFTCAVLLVFTVKHLDFNNDKIRKRSESLNDITTILILIITIINIFINVFLNI